MRIVQVITTLEPLGAQNHVLSLARGQIAAGHELRIVYLKGHGSLKQKFLAAGCASVTKISFDRPSQLFSAIWTLARHLRRVHADVIHTHLLKANALGGLAATFVGRKAVVVATKHNDEHQLRNPLVGLLHGLLSWLFDDKVISVSDHVAQFVKSQGHIPDRKIIRIYNGFDWELYENSKPIDVRQEFDLPLDAFVFGIIGRVTRQKNHLLLLEAFSRLRQNYPQVRLLIVGGKGYTGAYFERVKEETDRLRLRNHTVMTGWRADAFSIIGGLDSLVMPSAWEGLGMVLLEAIVQGVPVIATKTGGITEVVRDGLDGILVPSGDTEALLRAMEDIIKRHHAFVARTRLTGRPYVAKKFGLTTMQVETLSVYNAAGAAKASK
jgi:glycosyltransferase involved in cell wall biosynthesis